MCIVRTDGSDAGTVTSFTAGQYDPQVITMNEVWWITNTRVIFTARQQLDGGRSLRVRHEATATISNLTRTTTGSQVPPFTQGGTAGNVAVRGSFMSDNGAYYYFARGHADDHGPAWAPTGRGLNVSSMALFDVSGNEFSGGSTSSLRRSP
jgi:hypothetical protein